MKKEPFSRREREKLQQRQDMLDAALVLFSEKGYHNVSMHEIAKKAEFAIGTLYKFFQNKEDLYKSLVMEHSEMFGEVIIGAMEAPGDGVEKLRGYAQAKADICHNNMAFVRLFLVEHTGPGYNVKTGLDEEDMRQRYNIIIEKLASIFAKGIKSGEFRDIADPYSLAMALDSTINALILLSVQEPEQHPYPEDPDAILDIFFKGLIDP